jgi:hypothetical protein
VQCTAPIYAVYIKYAYTYIHTYIYIYIYTYIYTYIYIYMQECNICSPGGGQGGEQVGEQGDVPQAVRGPAAVQLVPLLDEVEGVSRPVRPVGGDDVHVAAHEGAAGRGRPRVLDDQVAAALDEGDSLDDQRPSVGSGQGGEDLEDMLDGKIFLGDESLGRAVLQLFGLANQLLQQSEEPGLIEPDTGEHTLTHR